QTISPFARQSDLVAALAKTMHCGQILHRGLFPRHGSSSPPAGYHGYIALNHFVISKYRLIITFKPILLVIHLNINDNHYHLRIY
ncbi:MAG: hypothetical protein KAR30_04435, partial [Gammaproteobacteria bacterium]|nr:hypothetical protein [Gammaproteobacteria bacterium]